MSTNDAGNSGGVPSSMVPTAEGEEMGFRGRAPRGVYALSGREPVDIDPYPGALICLEGTDSVGRSSHVALLREWCENAGFGVVYTELTESPLVSEGLKRAKEGHTLGPITMDLFYTTDFADRLETQILPALRAGFVVLTDRYVYSAMARSIVRGTDPNWIEDAYRFAPKPDAVIYLDVSVECLIPRVLASGGFDYWESGRDFQEERDIFRSFSRYQRRLLQVFDQLSERYGFRRVDANREIDEVFPEIRQAVIEALEATGVSPK
ncbi:MAG: dTMP kinase [Phycisphaerales bacterium]